MNRQNSTAYYQKRMMQLAPGIGLAIGIGLLAWGIQIVEEHLVGQAVIEALVIAILLGMLLRMIGGIRDNMLPGLAFSAKEVLEFAIVLLGASVNLAAIVAAGATLIGAIVTAVIVGMSISIVIGRMIGLNPKLAILVAAGNSICGNSAIAAVAPVIHADSEDVASAIALTAVLGVAVVLMLPLLIPLLGFSFYQYGVLAGMTVYAVPQVLAATIPVSIVSGEIGTLVKLVRVLMLGPVVLFLSLRQHDGVRLPLSRFIPWFLIGFLVLGVLRSANLLPVTLADTFREGSRWLTLMAMAALGASVDIQAVRRVGRSVATTVALSLLALICISATLIIGLHIHA